MKRADLRGMVRVPAASVRDSPPPRCGVCRGEMPLVARYETEARPPDAMVWVCSSCEGAART